MSVSVEQKSAVARRLVITIPGERIESEVTDRLNDYGKNAKIKGFRPGKAPASIVRREYGGAVRADVLKEMMGSHYSEAITEEGLEPVGLPAFDTGEPGTDGSFTFTADIEVYPEFEPDGLDRLELRRARVEITDEDVATVLERLRGQREEWRPVERPAREGDRVVVNFEGLVEGEPFPGNQGKSVPLTLGAGEMIPGFEVGLEGIASGETRTLDLVFPEKYRASELAGKPVHFEITALEVREAETPALDAEFAATFDCGDVEQLRARVRDNMESELAARIAEDLQRQVGDQIVDANPIEVPQALVDQEVERQQRQLLQRLGIKTEGARVPELPREPYVETAERRIRLGLILGDLIRREAFRPDPERVERRIEALCADLEDPVAGARQLRADSEAMRNVEAMVLEDMIYDWLIERAATREEPVEFFAYMEPKENAESDAAATQKEGTNDE